MLMMPSGLRDTCIVACLVISRVGQSIELCLTNVLIRPMKERKALIKGISDRLASNSVLEFLAELGQQLETVFFVRRLVVDNLELNFAM